MADIAKREIRKLVREVLSEMSFDEKAGSQKIYPPVKGPYVLSVFHAGVRKLDAALGQIQKIMPSTGQTGIFTGESARQWISGTDVREKIGAHCILDTVNADGLNKVLQRADVLVLPTFCLKVAAKVAHFICDDLESNIVLSALLQGKKVLAARDGFLVCDMLVNNFLKKEIEQILGKLESFGIVFCATEELSEVFDQVILQEKKVDGPKRQDPPDAKTTETMRLVTARDIYTTVRQNKRSIKLSPGGIVTPLARDLAKEYSIQIVEN